MTTLRQIIIDALRESGVIAVGTTPEADVHDEALRRLQNLITSLFGSELGENLLTFDYESIKDEDYVPANSRVIFDLDSAATVKLKKNPRDGARFAVIDHGGNFSTNNLTLDGNGRKIEDSDTLALSTNSLNREWFYRGDLGNWVRVTSLTASSESPFPAEFDDLLMLMLAMRINPRYAAETLPETLQSLGRSLRQFRARYRQEHEEPAEDALTILPSSYRFGMYGVEEFNKGS